LKQSERGEMKIRILGMMTVFLLVGAAFAAAPDFRGLDRDGNGYLDQSEIDGSAPEIFKNHDRDGDGFLDRSEFEAAGGSPPRFDEIDGDKNGRIDLEEFRAVARKRFEQFDVNREGRIDVQNWDRRQTPVVNPLIHFYF